MQSKGLVRPRVLIVEDHKLQREAINDDLDSIPYSIRMNYIISSFEVDEVGCVSEAIAKLENAISNSLPYHLVLLDLGIPETPAYSGINDRENEFDDMQITRHGYSVLKFIAEKGGAMGVIVVTVFKEYEFVARAFRGGAVDFIAKPVRTVDLQTQVLSYWARLLSKESIKILEQRIKSLIPYAEKGLAHRFTATFSELLTSVTRAAGEIELFARERFGLDPERDAHDVLILQLRAHKESVVEARKEWAKLQALLSREGDDPQVEAIEDILDEINESLLPCLTVKKTKLIFDLPQAGKSYVLTFHKDVLAVLREIIVGGLSELSDYGDSHHLKVTVGRNDTRAIVRIEDDLKTIQRENANAINEGYSMVPDLDFGREWGLSIAQHVAMRGGGELVIEPKLQGNIITFRIPLAQHE